MHRPRPLMQRRADRMNCIGTQHKDLARLEQPPRHRPNAIITTHKKALLLATLETPDERIDQMIMRRLQDPRQRIDRHYRHRVILKKDTIPAQRQTRRSYIHNLIRLKHRGKLDRVRHQLAQQRRDPLTSIIACGGLATRVHELRHDQWCFHRLILPRHLRCELMAWLTQAQMIEIDRVMIDELGITLVQMMENAGRNLAQLALDRYQPSTVVVAVGSGGNGGGGMVAARHLANRGINAIVTTTRRVDEMSGVPARQIQILDRLGVPILPILDGHELPEPDLWIDAVIGYSLNGAPTGPSATLIDVMNRSHAPILSLDVPSGIDATTGQKPGVAANADATMTLAAPKQGLATAVETGALFVADISLPPAVLQSFGVCPPDFSKTSVVAIKR